MVNIDQYIELNSEILDCELLLQIHDELIFEVKTEHLQTVATKICEIMSSVVNLDIPLPVKASYGPTWGQLNNIC